jgi:hypothetical protein
MSAGRQGYPKFRRGDQSTLSIRQPSRPVKRLCLNLDEEKEHRYGLLAFIVRSFELLTHLSCVARGEYERQRRPCICLVQ